MKNSIPKVVVLTEIPTPYRQPVFDVLAKRDDLRIDFVYLARKQKDRNWNPEALNRQYAKFLRGRQICFPGHHTIHINGGVAETLTKPKYDLYVLGGYLQPALIQVLRFCWKTKTPYIMLTESHLGKKRSWLVRKIKDGYVRKVYERSAANLVMGSAARAYVEYYGASKSTSFYFPNMIDAPNYSKLVEQEKKEASLLKEKLFGNSLRTILFVGAFTKIKGVDLLVDAFDHLHGNIDAVNVLLLGSGALEQSIRAQVIQKSMEKHVKIHGFVQPNELPTYYAMADVLVLPSRQETFGAVICEAMAAGLPVVASDAVGAVADFVKDEVNGAVFPVGNVEKLAQALKGILSSEEERREMGKKSKEIISEWSHMRLTEEFERAIKIALHP